MKVKEFYKKHEKKAKAAALVAVGAGITGVVVLLHKKYLDSSPKSFITDPFPLDNGKYAFAFGLITKLGHKVRVETVTFDPKSCIEFGERIINIVKTCEDIDVI